MSLARPFRPRPRQLHGNGRISHGRNSSMFMKATAATNYNPSYNSWPYDSKYFMNNNGPFGGGAQNLVPDVPSYNHAWPDIVPSSKRRKFSNFPHETNYRPFEGPTIYRNGPNNHADMWQHLPPPNSNDYYSAPLVCDKNPTITAVTKSDGACAVASTKRSRSKFEDDEDVFFMSRDDLDRCSPSRKDGIDVLHETHLRYSYCAFLQNLGLRLDLPQTTTATAMVICHRFFVRRSHASHDGFLIATAALFLVSKSEETPRPLNDVLRASCEVFHKQDLAVLSRMFPIDWFDQYRERVTEAEQLILTTLNFELNVQHPYEPLASTLESLGFSQSILVTVALSLVNEGLRSSLWLQFKPHQIAAGAAYLASKILNMNLSSCHNVWNEFHTPPSVLRDVAHQLMELF